LIEHFRTKNKDNSLLSHLISKYEELCISPLVLYEILVGQTESPVFDSNAVLDKLTLLPFGEADVTRAAEIRRTLKKKNKLIDHLDILIAAGAIVHDVPLATLNRKHFEHIEGLILVDDEGSLP